MESDYENIEVNSDKGNEAYKKANEIRSYIINNFNVCCRYIINIEVNAIKTALISLLWLLSYTKILKYIAKNLITRYLPSNLTKVIECFADVLRHKIARNAAF